MTTFQFLPNPSSGNFAIRRFNLESDVMPSRADGGNGGRTRTDAVVQHHIALVGIGAHQVLYQGYRLLCRMIESVLAFILNICPKAGFEYAQVL